MKYTEFMDLIVNSRPQDWEFNKEDEFFTFFLKDNISVSIDLDHTGERISPQNYWYDKFDGEVSFKRVFLKYNGVIINTSYFAIPDERNIFLPMPFGKSKISKKQNALSRIINMSYEEDGIDYSKQLTNIFDQYGIVVTPD